MDWNKIIESALMVIIPIVVPALVVYVMAELKKLMVQFKQTNPDMAYAVEEAAKFSIAAAEQLYATGKIQSKKVYALGVAEQYLALRGVTVDLHILDAAIESAVWTELNKDKVK